MEAVGTRKTGGKYLILLVVYVCGNIIAGLLDYLLADTIRISPLFLTVFNTFALVYFLLQIKPASLQKTMIVSVLAHVVLLLVLCMAVKNLPFNDIPEPVLVTIDNGPSQMAQGNNSTAQQTTAAQTAQVQQTAQTRPNSAAQTVQQQTTPARHSGGLREVADNSADVQQNSQSSSRNNVLTTPNDSTHHVSAADNAQVQQVANNVDQAMQDNAARNAQNSEFNQINQNVENALNQSSSSSSSSHSSSSSSSASGDPLSDASWSFVPRKTIYFPDIESKIPAEYRQRGMGYSVKVRITFDRFGNATAVDLVESSGDPTIDNIFLIQLRKIRVEPIDVIRTDVVLKTFTIKLR